MSKDLVTELLQDALTRIQVLENHMKEARDLQKTQCECHGDYLPDVDGIHKRKTIGTDGKVG